MAKTIVDTQCVNPQMLKKGDVFKFDTKDFGVYKVIDTEPLKRNRTLITYGSQHYRGNDSTRVFENYTKLYKIKNNG